MSTCENPIMLFIRRVACQGPLLGLAVRLHGSHTGLARLIVLESLACCVVNGTLAGNDLLDGGENAAPVLEDGEGHALAGTVGDEIW